MNSIKWGLKSPSPQEAHEEKLTSSYKKNNETNNLSPC